MASRSARELEEDLSSNSMCQSDINLFKLILNQQKSDSNKIYFIHEPDVQYISKGKEHKKYELRTRFQISTRKPPR